MYLGSILMLLLWLVVLGAIAWFVEQYAPMPAPFKMLIRVIILIVVVMLLINFFIGYAPLSPPVLRR